MLFYLNFVIILRNLLIIFLFYFYQAPIMPNHVENHVEHHVENFVNFDLSEELNSALNKLNFTVPTPIQVQAIPYLLEGRDLIGLAQTGTGKTLAFALPILEKILIHEHSPQALILTPTRELAIQVASHIEKLANNGIKITVLCGGQDYKPQLKKLKEGSHIVVGTPGRILDHLERKSLKLNTLKTFVLDEADEMLRMGFIEDVESILSRLPSNKQLALFSATMPDRIRKIAKHYLTDPITVEIKSSVTVKNIEQQFLFASPSQKPNALLRILAAENFQGVIIFVKTKNATEETATLLQQYGYNALALHGDLSQALRERIITQFKQARINILVATDVAARGLDVDYVTHVINYDIAQDVETYVHRIGRTGRAGRSGKTILFVSPKEARMLNNIERHTKQSIQKINMPSDEMIQKNKELKFFQKIQGRLDHTNLNTYKEMLNKYAKENLLDILDVCAALALLYNKDEMLNLKLPSVKEISFKEEGSFKRDRKKRDNIKKSNKKFDKNFEHDVYRLDVGRKHGVKPRNIVGAIANEARIDSVYIKDLKIHENYSTVNLPKNMTKNMVNDLNKARVCGRQLNLTLVSSY